MGPAGAGLEAQMGPYANLASNELKESSQFKSKVVFVFKAMNVKLFLIF